MRCFVERKSLNVDFSLLSGQAFRWRKRGRVWEGVVGQKLCRVVQEGNVITFTGFSLEEFKDYFGLNVPMAEILEESFKCPCVHHLAEKYKGLRILSQEPYECLLSFMLATNTNIKRIQTMVESLCMRFGERKRSGGRTYYTFPSPEQIHKGKEKITACRLGFRERYILEIAEKLAEGKIGIEPLLSLDYFSAKNELLKIRGVGQKVADCVCLFSLKHYQAFPIDVHIRRWFASQNFCELEPFRKELLGLKALGQRTYNMLGDFARKKFGRFAGYAQQYIFFDALVQSSKGMSPKSTTQAPA